MLHNFYDDVKSKFPNKKIDVTGHSLGGSLAKLMSNKTGHETVTFNAYPFKISTLQDGHDIWDDFNFELDMVQDTIFEVNGTKDIILYNNGAIGINPTVICSNDIGVTKGNSIYKFKQGEAKTWAFKLDKGLNTLTIKGTGTIEFKWCKEVL